MTRTSYRTKPCWKQRTAVQLNQNYLFNKNSVLQYFLFKDSAFPVRPIPRLVLRPRLTPRDTSYFNYELNYGSAHVRVDVVQVIGRCIIQERTAILKVSVRQNEAWSRRLRCLPGPNSIVINQGYSIGCVTIAERVLPLSPTAWNMWYNQQEYSGNTATPAQPFASNNKILFLQKM